VIGACRRHQWRREQKEQRYAGDGAEREEQRRITETLRHDAADRRAERRADVRSTSAPRGVVTAIPAMPAMVMTTPIPAGEQRRACRNTPRNGLRPA
jgi:hypothetical protein